MNLSKVELELQRGYKNKRRLALLSVYSCQVCQLLGVRQTTRTELHHLAGIGAGKKASDLLCFVLCLIHHQSGKVGEAVHKGIAEFEANFKSQIEFIGLVNEMIFRDNNLKGQDLKNYYLVRDWVKQKINSEVFSEVFI